MGDLKTARRKKLRRARGWGRQNDLWEQTGKVGHLRKRNEHGRALRFLTGVIERRSQIRGISPHGLAFIAEFEGFFPEPYNDPVGYATVGCGRLIGYRPVQASDRQGVWVQGQQAPGRLTKVEARRLLRQKIEANYEPAVRALFEPGGYLEGMWTQGRHDSLVSFAFNLGPNSVKGVPGFETMGRAIRSRDIQAIGDAFLLYDGSAAGRLPGLTRRRQAERRMFLHGDYSTR